jgi:hypothetical protein
MRRTKYAPRPLIADPLWKIEQGPPGADGRDGMDGRNGVDGRDGVDGRNGKDGRDGEDAEKPEVIIYHGPRGRQGPKGDPGSGGGSTSIPATFDDAAEIGTPVYISGVNHVANAAATSLATSGVAGLCSAAVGSGGTSLYQTEGQITRDEWSGVADASLLTPGALYFLAVTGGLTATAPSGENEVVIVVGRAVDETTLDIEISQATLLSVSADDWEE